jgi:ArsR family metal-binding transcriptional regulator
MSLITNYKLELFPPPCFLGSAFWTGKVDFDGDLTEFLPYLNGYLKKRIYNPVAKTIIFNFENHKVSIRPKEVKISNIKDKEEGEVITRKLIDFLNELWDKKDSITPDYEKKEPPKVLDIYKILPKTNCGNCSHASCFVFATKLSQGDAEIYECSELDKEEKEQIEKLFWGDKQ